MYFDITWIFYIIIFIISVFIVLLGLSNWIVAPPKSKTLSERMFTMFRPDIHYKRCSEGDAEYLRKICPEDSAAAKDRLQILLDFDYWNEKYFLFRDDNEKLYLRKYSTRTPADGITRYVLEDVETSMIGDFKKAGNRLDRLCKETLGCGVQELFISYEDNWAVNILINTYDVQYTLLLDPIETAYKLETESVKPIHAKADSNAANNATHNTELAELYPDLDEIPDGFFINEFGELEAKEDFDPDFDEIPDGYFVNEFGELEPGDDPNQDPYNVGSDAWREQQQKFTNDSLYIYHDWDIFKIEEERCDADPCHNPYHHHKK